MSKPFVICTALQAPANLPPHPTPPHPTPPHPTPPHPTGAVTHQCRCLALRQAPLLALLGRNLSCLSLKILHLVLALAAQTPDMHSFITLVQTLQKLARDDTTLQTLHNKSTCPCMIPAPTP
jgi:hypothetical protein